MLSKDPLFITLLGLAKFSKAVPCLDYCVYAADYGETCANRGLINTSPTRMLPFGVENGDEALPIADDYCHGPMPVNSVWQVFGKEFGNSNIYLSANGNIQFGACQAEFTESPPPQSFSAIDADIDMTNGGQWFARVVTDAEELNKVSAFIQTNTAAGEGFFANDALVVTFQQVRSKGQHSSNNRENTFQMIIGSDGGATFGTVQYGSFEWTQDAVQIAAEAGDECLGGEPTTATVNPCEVTGCIGESTPFVKEINQQVESNTGNGVFNGQYSYNMTEPVIPETYPPPVELPAYWWPAQNYTWSTLPGAIKQVIPGMTEPQLATHGCYCRNIITGDNPGYIVDYHFRGDGGMDYTCQNWFASRQCVYLPGGACEGLEHLNLHYDMINGECPTSDGSPEQECQRQVCQIDLANYRRMNKNMDNIGGFIAPNDGDADMCGKPCRLEGNCPDRTVYQMTHCCGSGRGVQKYSPMTKTCSGRDLITPEVEQCKNVTLDLVVVVDTAEQDESTMGELIHFIEKFITYIGVLPEGDNLHVALIESANSARVVSGFSHNLQALKYSLNGMNNGTVRNLGQGLELASSLYSTRRSDVRFVTLVLSNGPSADDVSIPAADLQSKGYVYAMGIGANADQTQLDQMSSVIPEVYTNAKFSHEIGLFESGYFFGPRICTAVPKCANALLDIVFVVEASDSVGEVNFQKVKDFIINFTSSIPVTWHGVRVYMISYADTVNTHNFEFFARKYQHVHEFLDASEFMGGATSDPAAAIDVAMNLESLGRDGVDREIIVIGKTPTVMNSWTPLYGSKVRNIGVDGYAMAAADQNLVATYDTLDSVIDVLGPQLCSTKVEECVDKPIDMTLVIDGSGSVGEENFFKNLQWVKDLIMDLSVEPSGINIAMTQFSGGSSQYVEFHYLDNKQQVIDALDAVEYVGGGTHTGKAMSHAWNDVMNGRGRWGVAQPVMVVVTDGAAQDDVTIATDFLHANNIPVFAIGVGANTVTWSMLKEIATPEEGNFLQTDDVVKTVFKSDYDSLNKLNKIFGRTMCQYDNTV